MSAESAQAHPPAVARLWHALLALGVMFLLGVALIFLFPGSPEQDSGYHFLMSREAWKNPIYLVKVWARPLFTTLFALPALGGWVVARLVAVAIGLGIAWQTWQLARDLKLRGPWLVIPLLLAQPVFFELYTDLLTEPTFALVFITALRWHLRGWVKRGMVMAGFMLLARPEGFFIGALWGVWVLVEAWARDRRLVDLIRAIPSTLLLATGAFVWWLAAYALSDPHDPLFIKHDWPAQWVQGTYGNGPNLLSYASRGIEFAGLIMVFPLLLGLVLVFWRPWKREWLCIASPFLLLFGLHSVFWYLSAFGSAGYPRYMVCVAPSLALITLLGINALGTWLTRFGARLRLAAAVGGYALLAISVGLSFIYLDGLYWARDAKGIADTIRWIEANPRPVKKYVWSHAHMCVLSDRSLDENVQFTPDKAKNLQLLAGLPAGTMVVWDSNLGPDWHKLTAAEIRDGAGYEMLRTQVYPLPGVVLGESFAGWNISRQVEVSVLYKP